jgi:hypothetical protein
MNSHKDAERIAHYRQEASACAAKALTTPIAEIKQAYRDLEQGWLCLAPKAEQGPAAWVDPITVHDANRMPSRAPGDNTMQDKTGGDDL